MQSRSGLGSNPVEDHNGAIQRILDSKNSDREFSSVRLVALCGDCFKWRHVPTKEIYEAIRENNKDESFVCARAREWQTDISCALPSDIYQDDGNFWAIDRPGIPQTPQGWGRRIRMRNDKSTTYADIYYVTPTGKRLRTRVEVEKYLRDNPEYTRNGVNISQFSFPLPKPL